VKAKYLVAADGANGTVRERLQIARTGPGVLQHWQSASPHPFAHDYLEVRSCLSRRDVGACRQCVEYSPRFCAPSRSL
jgi:2-polyprenyl-6-methoxyphenol hydroxylase-like FAD-dependent oxidoreductase